MDLYRIGGREWSILSLQYRVKKFQCGFDNVSSCCFFGLHPAKFQYLTHEATLQASVKRGQSLVFILHDRSMSKLAHLFALS